MKLNIQDLFKNKQTKGEETEKNKKLPPVFYGVVTRVLTSMDKYISIAGEPVVFTGGEEEVEKFRNKLFMGKYKVIPLDEVLRLYPDRDIWVTYKKANATAKKLLKLYKDPNKIHFFEADLEYKKSCSFLGHFIDYRVDNFSPCCVSSNSAVKTSGSVAERIAHWEKYVTKLEEDIKNGVPNVCDGCKHLKDGFFPKKIKLDYICFATNHPGDVCNLRCSYCFVKSRFEKFKENKDGMTTYETIKQLSEMPEYNSSDITIELSNGELCANKYCNEIFDILLKMKWKVRFVTNMTIYNKKFAEFLKTGRTVNVLTSLDSGTPETFKKIKQVDCLNKVVANLKKYPLEKANLRLKYIFLEGINDNEKDVMGFYDIVKDVNCKVIMISSDRCKPLTPKMRDLVVELVKKAKKDGIKVSKSAYLSRQDDKFIDELTANETDLKAVSNKETNYKVINVDGKKITLDSDLLADNAKYVIIIGDNCTVTINGNISVNPKN